VLQASLVTADNRYSCG